MGYPHPDALLRELTYDQFREWWIYFTVEPFGEIRQDLRHGKSSQIALMPHLREGNRPPEIDKLIVNFESEADQVDDKELLAAIRQYKQEERERKEREQETEEWLVE